ncbi:MAG TPA: hypothetical protein DD000_11950 [Cyanobacteria bacterium UBA11166]|nr:hypothetical protein [Cyanobacteria bacterium UBA11166]
MKCPQCAEVVKQWCQINGIPGYKLQLKTQYDTDGWKSLFLRLFRHFHHL